MWRTYSASLIILIVFCSCSGVRQNISPTAYSVVGRNYTHAIYNSENRLITHPLDDLFHEVKRRIQAGEPPISDIYIIAHGWNYTGGLAEINYHNYVNMLDEFIEHGNVDRKFQPYLILVTWTSTVRPVSSISNAVLPFGLDELVRPIASLVDRGPVHLITAWKQAMNAATIALGRDLPDAYLGTSWAKEPYGVQETYYGERDTGQDLPLSAVIFEILSAKYKNLANSHLGPLHALFQQCQSQANQPYLLLLAQEHKLVEQLRNSFAKSKLHLVGHSYGAKLVALAGMEGIRRWLLLDYLKYPVGNLETCDFSAIAKDPPREIIHTERRRQLSLLSSSVTGETEDARKTIQQLYDDNPDLLEQGPIESLLTISPALHPGEFQYVTRWPAAFASIQTLKLITRKAVVYSLYDRANGWAFNLRDLLLNPQVAQAFQAPTQNEYLVEGLTGTTAFRSLNAAVSGPFGFGYSLAYGAMYYLFSLAINTPADFVYHVINNTFNGNLRSPKDENSMFLSGAKGVLNSLDYFLPLFPPFPLRHENEQGIARLTRPGLGKTGLVRAGAGRNKLISLWTLKEFVNTSRDVGPDSVCRFSASLLLDLSPVKASDSKDEILSFDASKIYDTLFSIAGSHGNVRDFDNAQCKLSGGKSAEIPKRLHTFYLVMNFTKMNYRNWLAGEPVN